MGNPAGAPRFDPSALDTIASPAWQAFLAQQFTALDALAAQPAWTSTVRPEVLGRDIASIHAEAVAADESGFFGRKKRRRAALARIADVLLVDQKTFDLKTLSTLTGAIAESQRAVTTFTASVQQLPSSGIATSFNPYLPDEADALRTRLGWLAWLGRTIGVAAPTAQPQAQVGEHVADLRRYYSTTQSGALAQELHALADARTNLAPALYGEQALAWSAGAPLNEWRETRAARSLGDTVQLSRWLDFLHALEPLRTAGLGKAREALLWGDVPAEDAVLALDKGIAQASVAERGIASGLADFDSLAHLKTISRFTGSSAAVRAELPHAIPVDVLGHRTFNADAMNGQIGLLRRQLDRQRGGMSVRALLDNFGDLITQLMPCTLMSPESVARFFPARQDVFDLVVFDEASQIRVADAIGAMGRARSVVVVGDSKQMPPTSFAEVSSGVDEEDEAPDVVIDEESILSECAKAGVPSKWLSWHYRSQDESLILFSNQRYYENRLSSFPAPLHERATATHNGHGISLVRVDGVFERSGRGKLLRTNQVEAHAIVDDVRRRFEASPDATPSLGIITFNAQQRDFIENLLRDSGVERIVKALDEPDGLFVKNLENVQGDERDSILFSVAFSANDRGVVPLNFGPLSRAGGERRLNVAITRARRQVVLYASFDPRELRSGETASVGLKHLRAYLELAQRGAESVAGDGGRRAALDRHRDEIADDLRMLGFAVATDVGLSEFRVDISIATADAPTRPLVAVLLDGPAWRARRTVADRDGLPLDVLQGIMRWPDVERVWLPEWLGQRDEVLDRLARAVVNASAPKPDAATRSNEISSVRADGRPVGGDDTNADDRLGLAGIRNPVRSDERAGERFASAIAVPAEARPASSGAVGVVRGAAAGPIDYYANNSLVMEFDGWASEMLGTVDVLDGLPRVEASRRVQLAVRDAVAAEGPVHPDRLVRLVAAAFGLTRVNEARSSAIRRCVPSELRPDDGESFFWPEHVDPTNWHLVRRVRAGDQRPVEHVSLVEIANAMRVVAETAGGMDDDSIKREALAMFGGRRLTESVGARLDDALRFALERGRLERLPNGVLVGRQP